MHFSLVVVVVVDYGFESRNFQFNVFWKLFHDNCAQFARKTKRRARGGCRALRTHEEDAQVYDHEPHDRTDELLQTTKTLPLKSDTFGGFQGLKVILLRVPMVPLYVSAHFQACKSKAAN